MYILQPPHPLIHVHLLEEVPGLDQWNVHSTGKCKDRLLIFIEN